MWTSLSHKHQFPIFLKYKCFAKIIGKSVHYGHLFTKQKTCKTIALKFVYRSIWWLMPAIMIENRPRFTAKLPIIHRYVLFSVNYCMQGNVCLWVFFLLLSHRSEFQCLNCVWVNSRLGEAFCKYRRPKLTQGEKTLCTVLHGILHLFRVLNS